ncbi:hypothetical protein BDL97_05G132800 [Sphagnum fallax]|nr:hypothetical protein BDL97_05G132800 [Sphagnum fallax]
MASCALLRASAHGSASSSSRCSITFCPDATASAFYHPVCLNPVVKRQSPGVVKWVPPECLHVRGAAAAGRPTLKRVETVDINRQPHIRRDKSETQVLEFNDGNNELQQNRIEGSGSKILLGKSQEELEELAIALGEKKYRGRQLHLLIYKNKMNSIQDCAQLPKMFRDALEAEGWSMGRSTIHHSTISSDGTVKILLRLVDSRLVETVGIPVTEKSGGSRLTACVSSQVGCPLGCTFCATGKGGFARNLKPHEIIEQVLAIEELFKQRVTNVVFMGMGEPLLNIASVLAAHHVLNKEMLIGQRMMTISTVGVPNTINHLATHKLQSTLAISLHAPNQELRAQIVPSAKLYPLEVLMEDCRQYFQTTGRRVSFEYTLLAGVNDQKQHAEELADLLHRWNLGRHVNIIPYNPIADSEFQRPTKASVLAFVETLSTRRITASIRRTRGLDANAACGQLRNDFQKVPLNAALAIT